MVHCFIPHVTSLCFHVVSVVESLFFKEILGGELRWYEALLSVRQPPANRKTWLTQQLIQPHCVQTQLVGLHLFLYIYSLYTYKLNCWLQCEKFALKTVFVWVTNTQIYRHTWETCHSKQSDVALAASLNPNKQPSAEKRRHNLATADPRHLREKRATPEVCKCVTTNKVSVFYWLILLPGFWSPK